MKSRLYERAGVREYLAAVVAGERIVWKELVDGQFEAIEPSPDGVLRSRCFPGLWLDQAALWDRDQARLFAALHLGLASPEHAEFVARLAAARR